MDERDRGRDRKKVSSAGIQGKKQAFHYYALLTILLYLLTTFFLNELWLYEKKNVIHWKKKKHFFMIKI